MINGYYASDRCHKGYQIFYVDDYCLQHRVVYPVRQATFPSHVFIHESFILKPSPRVLRRFKYIGSSKADLLSYFGFSVPAPPTPEEIAAEELLRTQRREAILDRLQKRYGTISESTPFVI